MGDPADHGWKKDLTIDWIGDPYPKAVSDMLFDKVDGDCENDEYDFEEADDDDEEDYMYDDGDSDYDD